MSTKANPLFNGICAKNSSKASKAPAEPPMPTIYIERLSFAVAARSGSGAGSGSRLYRTIACVGRRFLVDFGMEFGCRRN
jgi:hypothetical protein